MEIRPRATSSAAPATAQTASAKLNGRRMTPAVESAAMVQIIAAGDMSGICGTATINQSFLPSGGPSRVPRSSVQHFSNGVGELLAAERLLDQIDARIEAALVD